MPRFYTSSILGVTKFIVHDEGTNLINRLRKFKLRQIEITGAGISFCVALKYKSNIERILGRRIFTSKTSNNVFTIANFLYARIALVIAAITCSIGFLICEQFSFRTQICGVEGAEKQHVAQFLRNNGFGAVTPKARAKDMELLVNLVNAFPFVAHASMTIQGSTISVNILRVDNFESEILGDIIATMDGVVAEILVFSGTANVMVGQVVKQGDILVGGNRPNAIIKIVNGEEQVIIVQGN